jgi:hypothetical protein
MAPDSILAGARWHEELRDALAQADVVLVAWTHDAARSTWVAREDESVIRDAQQVAPILGDERRASAPAPGRCYRPAGGGSRSKPLAPYTSRPPSVVSPNPLWPLPTT